MPEIFQQHFQTPEGRVEGGQTFGTGFAIAWQRGQLGQGADRKPPNGAFVEDVIRAVMGRLEAFQASSFKCEENEDALTHLELALDKLESRTKRRKQSGAEGTYKPD